MKIKRFQGNITILALFVLLGSALLGVLVALYMKNFFRYSEDINNYERANYLAKAGTELGLAIIGSREPGLEFTLESGHQFMKENFDCPFLVKEWEDCAFQPAFSLAISGLAQELDTCSENNKIKVWPGLSVIVPLFKDAGITDISEALHVGSQQARGDPLTFYGETRQRKFATLSLSDQNTLLLEQRTTPAEIKGKSNTYLIIANPNLNTQELCLKSPNGLPQESVKILSIGFFKDKQLWTETFAKQALPSFLQGDNYLVGE